MFRISERTSIPYVTKCGYEHGILTPHKKCRNPGANAELMGFTLEKMGVQYETFGKSALKKIFNGSSSVQKAIEAGVVDTSTGKYLMLGARMQQLEFSYPIEQQQPVFLVAKRTRTFLETAQMPILNFTVSLWAAAAISFITLVIIMFIYRGVKESSRQKRAKFHEYTIRGLVYNFHSRHEPTIAGNIIAVLLAITVLLVTRLYCAGLLTTLLHPPQVSPFKDCWEMLDLVEQGKVHIMVKSKTGWYYQEMMENKVHPYYERLREATKNNPVQIVSGHKKRMRLVLEGTHIYPAMDNIRTQGLIRQHCGMTMVEGGKHMPTYWVAFAFKKNSTWLKPFNAALMSTRLAVENLNHKYTDQVVHCKSTLIKGGAPLTVSMVFGVLILIAFGALFGGFAFVVEHINKAKDDAIERRRQSVHGILAIFGIDHQEEEERLPEHPM